jgi:hypothetical protein
MGGGVLNRPAKERVDEILNMYDQVSAERPRGYADWVVDDLVQEVRSLREIERKYNSPSGLGELRSAIARVESLCDQLRGGPSHLTAERFRAALRGGQ